jgi:hypothetical protein
MATQKGTGLSQKQFNVENQWSGRLASAANWLKILTTLACRIWDACQGHLAGKMASMTAWLKSCQAEFLYVSRARKDIHAF